MTPSQPTAAEWRPPLSIAERQLAVIFRRRRLQSSAFFPTAAAVAVEAMLTTMCSDSSISVHSPAAARSVSSCFVFFFFSRFAPREAAPNGVPEKENIHLDSTDAFSQKSIKVLNTNVGVRLYDVGRERE